MTALGPTSLSRRGPWPALVVTLSRRRGLSVSRRAAGGWWRGQIDAEGETDSKSSKSKQKSSADPTPDEQTATDSSDVLQK